MPYKLEWVKSPNYTPAAQAKAVFGQLREILLGAGHWWGDPAAGFSHQGVVNTFLNPHTQVSAQFVCSAGWVTEMVRPEDVSWATGSANAFTISGEVDPQIIYKWRGGNAAQLKKANEIFETLCEYIADKLGYRLLVWRPHNYWGNTQCNPIPWNEVMKRAKQIYTAKHTSPKPTPSPIPTPTNLVWTKFPTIVKYTCTKEPTILWNFGKSSWKDVKQVKTFNKGDMIDIYGSVYNADLKSTYLVTEYSFIKKYTNGFNQVDMLKYQAPVVIDPPRPEWVVNVRDITPVKLFVLTPETQIIDLNTLQPIKSLAKGTAIDFTRATTVKGVEYLISSFSAKNVMPNGIRKADVGIPANPPVNEKPEWLENWKDITDKTMYTRLDATIVNLLDGSSMGVIPVNTPVEIASATVWHGQEYLITKYSTDKKIPAGISLTDLDMHPVDNPNEPIEPDPEQPDIGGQLNLIVRILQAIAKFLGVKI